jgi:hypothetical protein
VFADDMAFDVLGQSAAESHVEDLHAAADTEDGSPACSQLPAEIDLELVQRRVHGAESRIRLGAVKARLHVPAARQKEAVERGDVHLVSGRDEDRLRVGVLDRPGVGTEVVGGPLGTGGDADPRPVAFQ